MSTTIESDHDRFEDRFGGLVIDVDGDNVELYGIEIEAALHNRTLWTQVDGDDRTHLVPGHHVVNRVGYFKSVKPWTDADLEDVFAWTL